MDNLSLNLHSHNIAVVQFLLAHHMYWACCAFFLEEYTKKTLCSILACSGKRSALFIRQDRVFEPPFRRLSCNVGAAGCGSLVSSRSTSLSDSWYFSLYSYTCGTTSGSTGEVGVLKCFGTRKLWLKVTFLANLSSSLDRRMILHCWQKCYIKTLYIKLISSIENHFYLTKTAKWVSSPFLSHFGSGGDSVGVTYALYLWPLEHFR